MKKVLLWIGLVGAGVFLVIMLMGVLALRNLGSGIQVEPNSLLTLELDSAMPDYDAGSLRTWFGYPQPTITSLVTVIDAAAADDHVSAILLETDRVGGGWAGLRAVRNALARFRATGKPVYAYLQMTVDQGYYLASVADSLWLTHSASGGIFLRGIGWERAYLKQLFSKLGLRFEVLHAGDYKGAFENFARESMSGPVRENLTRLLKDVSEVYITEIARDRGIEPEQLRELLRERESLFIHGEEAEQLGLVDGRLDRVALAERLRELSGDSPRLDFQEYLSTIDVDQWRRLREQVAVVHLEGVITTGSDLISQGESNIDSDTFLPLLEKLREWEQVAAVVLRINSPGGSAAISEDIWRGARAVAGAKPLVVTLGNVAASGGYYIACAGDYIIAQPNTITGSIGVVGMLLDATTLLDWVDVNYEQLSTSPYHSLGHPAFGLARRQRRQIEALLGDTYLEFKERVAAGRNLTLVEVEQVAQGQVWSGRQAVELALVDSLGELPDAINLAARRAGLDPSVTAVVHYPAQKGFLELITDLDFRSLVWPDAWSEVETALKQEEVDLLRELLQTRLIWNLE